MKTQTFRKRTPMPAGVDELWAWHERPGAFERLNPPFDPVKVVERSGGLEVGARTVIDMKLGRWVAQHTAFERGRLFRDEQVSGPFAKWVHTHRFEAVADGTSMLDDEVEYALPMGVLGRTFGGIATSTLERMFAYRHAVTRADLLRHSAFAGRGRLTFALTGASGLVASALGPFLTTGGHAVRAVKRSGSEFDAAALDGADVVVNLAGAGVADERWTDARKKLLIDSRVDYTRRLVEAMRRRPPKVLVQGSAIGIYGDRGDEVLTEQSALGDRSAGPAGFLAGLCIDWEAAAREAEKLGTRVVQLRIGVVQTAQGGALSKLLTPFKAGAGGPIGDGRAWQSWISLEDLLGAILHVTFTASVRGPVNAVAPNAVTSRDYAKALGRVLSRPAVMPLPALALRTMFGEMGEGVLLASQHVKPAALEASGFRFLHPTLEDALRFTLGR